MRGNEPPSISTRCKTQGLRRVCKLQEVAQNES